MTPSRRSRKSPRRRASAARRQEEPRPRFVGRDPSPVLDKYPPRASPLRGPPTATAPAGASSAPLVPPSGTAPPGAVSAPATNLIRLERPFDLDEFSTLLGETTIRIRVPREDLPEVLRRVTDFMGFGVYVYSISVRPSASASLKEFDVELDRVDFVAERQRWEPFVERGAVPPPDGG